MLNYTFVKPERVWLQELPELREKWVQERIAEDPAILGLGDLILKDKERNQPRAGRLDLLLQEDDSNRRYEVEIQLGGTDESHIIRTVEYWDIERKRYPQYDHCAVIVAEDITARFLNVISLFNGHIPIIAVQMMALRFGQQISLVFTTVMDQLALGLDEEDDELQAVADRSYWEQRGTKATVAMADELLNLIKAFDPGSDLKYNRFYIGLSENDRPNNFAIFRPRKQVVNVELKLPQSPEVDRLFEEAALDVMDYDKRWGNYRFRLSQNEIKERAELLTMLFKKAYERAKGF